MTTKKDLQKYLGRLREDARQARERARIGELLVERDAARDRYDRGWDAQIAAYAATDTRNGERAEVIFVPEDAPGGRRKREPGVYCLCEGQRCLHEEAVRLHLGLAPREWGLPEGKEARRDWLDVVDVRCLSVTYEDGSRRVFLGVRETDDLEGVDTLDLHEVERLDERGSSNGDASSPSSLAGEIERRRRAAIELSEPRVLSLVLSREEDWLLRLAFADPESGEEVIGSEETATIKQSGRQRGNPPKNTLLEPPWMVDLIRACLSGTPLEQSTRRLGVEVTPEVVGAVNGRQVCAYLTERDGDWVYGRRTKKHTVELLPAEATRTAAETPPEPETPEEAPPRADTGPGAPPEGGEEALVSARSGHPEGSTDDLKEKARRLGLDFSDLLRAEERRGRV